MKKDSDNSVLAPAPLPDPEALAVREQLERVTASAAFRNSKRYPDFLRYTVEHTLTGETENIKERVLGIEIFRRDPDYDTNSDPVVRMTAAEVRKRLDQYYRVRGHEHEIRIEYPRGSYVPEFVWPRPAPPAELPPLQIEVASKHGPPRQELLYVVLACVVAGSVLWAAIARRQNALDRFWAPIFDSKATVLLCIPDMSIMVRDAEKARPQNPTGTIFGDALSRLPIGFQRDEVSFVDAYTVMSVASALTRRGRNFRLFHTEDATLDDLKQGPAVLIGGTNNPWINQVSSTLRFSLAKDGPLDYISDRQSPASRQWAITWQNPTTDYAIVSRVFNTTAGQPVVIAAGVHRTGTEAAGECLSDPACFAQAEKLAPGDWAHANVQFIIQTQVVNEVPGTPNVVAAYLLH
ncbi:MAG TPA: hypothetical protein VMB47_05855 [Candidatus Aquilonibacter sp.]|nr:hypothetical protein [Candidatus Aquilonibacter sp.]